MGIGDWGLGIGDWAQSPIIFINHINQIPKKLLITYKFIYQIYKM